MDVLVFANPRDPEKERFLREISRIPHLSPTFVLAREGLRSLLRGKAFSRRVIVFFAYEPADLNLALSLKEYLSDTRVIMVLHQTDAESVKQGLSLSPSFLTYANSDFSDIVAVLEKISVLENSCIGDACVGTRPMKTRLGIDHKMPTKEI